jgi:hypothetical protein
VLSVSGCATQQSGACMSFSAALQTPLAFIEFILYDCSNYCAKEMHV